MRFVLPLLLALIGAAAGVGAGLYLKPSADAALPEGSHETGQETTATSSEPGHEAAPAEAGHEAAPAADAHSAAPAEGGHDSGQAAEHGAEAGGEHAADGAPATSEFVKLNNQFIVPVLRDGKINSLVVLSLSVETPAGQSEFIYTQEPRLRDAFLQVLFDYANSGGFDGEFTNGNNMNTLRDELLMSGKKLLGDDIISLLITDIGRQDMG